METTTALKGLELASPVSSHHLLTNQAIPHHKNDEFRTSSEYLTKRRIHRHDLLSLLITSPTVQFTSHHMGNYIFLAETPFPQLLVDLLNFCSTSRISFSRIVSKCSVFSILSILKCSVVSGGEIDRFPSNHIINIFHQLNLDRIMLAFEMPACLSPSTHKSRGIQRCISHYEKALKLQNHSRIFVIWDPVVE